MYIFYSDPGHAWLRVPKTEVEPIKHKISSCSYMDKDNVYLEEDCDALLFLNFKFGKNISYQSLHNKHIIKEEYKENIFIRNLPHFCNFPIDQIFSFI